MLATAGGLGLGIYSLLGLGLGLAGWLNRPVAILFPVVSTLLFVFDLLRQHPDRIDRTGIKTWLYEPAGAGWLWLIPVVSLAIAAVSASIMPGILWKPLDPHPYDVTSYHLLVPREWYEGGRIVPLDHNVFSYFPFNVEMQFLLLMHFMGGPWAGMYACQFVSAGYAGLMVLGVYGVGEKCEEKKDERRTSNVEHRTSKSDPSLLRRSTFDVERSAFAFSSLIAAAFAACVPWVIMLAGVAYVESGLMLYTALAIAWALHAFGNPDRLIKSLIVSGVMGGLACGVKITAVPMLLMAIPAAMVVAMGFSRRVVVGCCGFVIAGSIVLSPWLIRNFAWSGNPLFPIGMSVLGQDHFTDQQVERFRIAHSPTVMQKTFGSKLEILWRDVIAHWQYGFILLPVALVAGAMGWRDRQMWILVICGLFVLVVWIGFTHLLPRFAVMLIPIGAIAIGRIRWGRAWPAGIVLLLVAVGLGWSHVVPELFAQSNPPAMNGQPQYALMGLEDLRLIMPQELIDARDRHMQIGLVGDAQAFLYQIPMTQMHYRTVFNLVGDDPVDAWVGSQAKGDPSWFLVINPMEIDRLHRTYRGVPPLPAAWAARGPDTFFMRGDEFEKPAAQH